jgi:hypothetical protein
MLAGTRRSAGTDLTKAIEWARATRAAGAPVLAAPPFKSDKAPEMIGTAILFHYINRPVTVFCDESPLPAARRFFRSGVLWVAGLRFREFVRKRPSPGATLDLLPDAPLPPDFAWASSSPAIARAWAQFCAVVERTGEAALSPAVRRAVADRLEGWKGEEPGLGQAWLNEALDGVPHSDRAAGRLAMLVALAPYRVDGEVVQAYVRNLDGGSGRDAQLVAAVCWSALAAARRVATWLGAGP